MRKEPWEERAEPGRGSFRGVAFYVATSESEIGRRVVVHEFPRASVPSVEDLGRLSRRFRLDCFVVGPSYDIARDTLRGAFEKAGPGPLRHPYYGARTVQVVGPIQIVESVNQGGMARFSVDVVEVADTQETVRIDTGVAVLTKAATARTAMQTAFANVMSVAQATQRVRDAVTGTIQSLASNMRRLRGAIDASLNTVGDIAGGIDALADGVSSLINAPGDLAAAIVGVYVSIEGAVDQVQDSAENLLALFGQSGTEAAAGGTSIDAGHRIGSVMSVFRTATSFGDGDAAIPETTPQRLIEKANHDAVVALAKQAATVSTAAMLAKLTMPDSTTAFSVFSEVGYQLAALADASNDDATYAALHDLRGALSAHLVDQRDTLPRLETYTPPQSTPALVLAYNLLGDASRDFEIIERNRVKHPAFVPGGVPLAVVRDA